MRVKGNRFIRNRASEGGAIADNSWKPQIEEDNLFDSNIADIYGPNVASYPARVVFIEGDERELTFNFSSAYAPFVTQSTSALTDFAFSNQKSGASLRPFYLAVLDGNDQVVRSFTGGTRLSFRLETIDPSVYLPVATSTHSIIASRGIYNISELTVIAEPNTQVLLRLFSPSALSFRPDVQTPFDLTTTIEMRTCLPGEGFLGNGECRECEPGTFMMEAALSPANCEVCLPRANCFGGTAIGPKPGFWRSSNSSINFISCFNPGACLGRQSPDEAEQGECAKGYRGVLCGQCESGYSRDSQFQCASCPEPWKNILLLSVFFLLTVAALVLLVKYTLKSAKEEKSPFSIYLRVLINHFQLIFLTSTFDLSWPDQVSSLYAASEPVANVSQKIISLDCFISCKPPSLTQPPPPPASTSTSSATFCCPSPSRSWLSSSGWSRPIADRCAAAPPPPS